MVNDTKQFFTLALGVMIVSILLTSVVFVSGCVGGPTCTSSNIDNCTTSQACFKGICTAKCSDSSDCTAANTTCRVATSDESGDKTSSNAKFCLSKISSETTSTSETTPTTQTSTSIYDNPPQTGISNNLLDTIVYVESSKVKPVSEVWINIEVKNKGSKGENTNIIKDYFNNVVKLDAVRFNNITAKIEKTSSGSRVSFPYSSINSLTLLDGENTNTSYKFITPSAKVGEYFDFTYKINTHNTNSNPDLYNSASYISFSDVLLGSGDNFKVTLKNVSDNYAIFIPQSVDFKTLSLKFNNTDNTYCTSTYCTKEYNITFALNNESFVLKNIAGPEKRGGVTDVSITSSLKDIAADELNKTNNEITFPINITLNNIQDISLQKDEEKQYPITLSLLIVEARLVKYESGEGTAKIYINSCNGNDDCKDNKICKNEMCVVKGSSTNNNGGQV